MKKMIRLKGLCLKVSETLNTKKIEKKKKSKMHTSASVQNQSPDPKAVKHNLLEEAKNI